MRRSAEQERSLTALVAGAISRSSIDITTSEKWALMPADIFRNFLTTM